VFYYLCSTKTFLVITDILIQGNDYVPEIESEVKESFTYTTIQSV